MDNFKLEFWPTLSASEPFEMLFGSEQDAQLAFATIARYDIFLDDNGYRNIDANMGTVSQYIDGEWIECEEEFED